MRHGVHRVRHQVGTIVNGTDVDSRRQPCRVDILYCLVDALEHFGGILAAAHEHNAFHACLAADTEDTGRLRGADFDLADVADKDRHTLLFGHHDVFDVVGGLDQAHAADHHGLLAVVQHGAAGVLVVGAHGLRNLSDGEVVLIHGSGRQLHLV